MTATAQTAETAADQTSAWVKRALVLATLANVATLCFISLPVIGFFLMTFGGWTEGAWAGTAGGMFVWIVIMTAAAGLPLGAIILAWRLYARRSYALALIAGLVVPVLGGALYWLSTSHVAAPSAPIAATP